MADILLGLDGTGVAAEYHARYASLTKGFRLQSVNSRERKRAVDFALSHGIPKVFDDIEYLFEGSDIDFLVVANETSFHFRTAQDAFERGLGVIVETPCTLTLREAKALVETAEEEGAYLFVANPMLSMPVVRFLKELLQSGALGEIHRVSLSLSLGVCQRNPGYQNWRLDPALSGGPLYTEGAMVLEVLSALFGILRLKEGEETGKAWTLLLQSGDTQIDLHLSSEDQKFLQFTILGEFGEVKTENNTLLSWPSDLALPSFPDGFKREEKTLFSPYDYLGETYREIRRSVESGEELEESFQWILQTAFLLDVFKTIRIVKES
ncbi:MAG: Gfo/Idh/MocA family oxidoreductase [Spirochaetales bacterium]|nr:Gfo/Idh/MocA family oxidoreductase [Candidatus Physcosoma equi]